MAAPNENVALKQDLGALSNDLRTLKDFNARVKQWHEGLYETTHRCFSQYCIKLIEVPSI